MNIDRKKKIALGAVLIGCAVVIILFLSFSPITRQAVRSTPLSHEAINGVQVRDRMDDPAFVSRYGSPISKDDNDLYDYYHWAGGPVTASVNSGDKQGTIMRVILTDPEGQPSSAQLQTEKGIRLGDSKEKVLALYGGDYYTSREQGADIIGYIDHEEHLTLEFWCSEGKVAEIRLDDSTVK
ncbi:hypothetical protein [Gorillibacterium timonense]|uniref:hypothetical protein n=1 Tax=Gorillibacterium timonense TaxID=1689269 RepID=UPI0011DE225F|nr:hypothetical protein [Gorillibacterium timonense]